MKIPEWPAPHQQEANLGGNIWSVSRLIELSRDFPVLEIPLDHLYLYNTYEKLSLRKMAMHMRAVQCADLNIPIILDEDGDIMDGRHRVIKAMLMNVSTIKAVRFDENPPPDRIEK